MLSPVGSAFPCLSGAAHPVQSLSMSLKRHAHLMPFEAINACKRQDCMKVSSTLTVRNLSLSLSVSYSVSLFLSLSSPPPPPPPPLCMEVGRAGGQHCRQQKSLHFTKV